MTDISVLRSLAEGMARHLVFTRQSPVGGRRLVVSPGVGGLKYLLKSADAWDPQLLRVASLLVMPGACVWDIGANIGLFSVAAAHHAGPSGFVLAVEADTDAVRLLYRTAQIQPAGQCAIQVVPVAIARSAGFVQFAIAKRARAANAIKGYGSTQTGGVKELRTIPAMALDDLLNHFPPPTVLKIDVEGAELEVLSGAASVLSRVRPVVYCEVTKQNELDVSALFQSYGYRLYDGSSYEGISSKAVDLCCHNTVAIPLSKGEQ